MPPYADSRRQFEPIRAHCVIQESVPPCLRVHLAINEEVRAMDVLFIGFGPFHVEAYGTLAIVVVALIVGAYLLGRGGRPR